MHRLAWVRLMVARHPWIYWLAIVVTAGVIALGAARAMAGSRRRHAGHGDHNRRCGSRLPPSRPGNPSLPPLVTSRLQSCPPEQSSRARDGAFARQHVGPGEIVTESDVTAGGPAGLIPDGWVAFAVTASVEHFATADHLNVYSGDQLVTAGVVIGTGDSELMVAIPAEAAPTMAAALLAGTVTLGLTPGP